jgi:hypothetical protein
MARVRVTANNIQSKLTDWAQSATNRGDELVCLPEDVDMKDAQKKSFYGPSKMVVKVQPDATDPFIKITFVEILL